MELKKEKMRGREMLSRVPVPEEDTGKKDSCQLRGSVCYVSHQNGNQKWKSEAKNQDEGRVTELIFNEDSENQVQAQLSGPKITSSHLVVS